MTRLVLNADDAGLAGPLSRRVAALLRAGPLSDTSLLAVGAACREASEALRAAGVAEAGVHLCLVGGEAPLSAPDAVRSLAPTGRFPASWLSVAARVSSGRVRIAEVEREWEAQTEAVLAEGFRLTHLDSHQHLHLLHRLLPVALALARRFAIPFVRAPRFDDPAAFASPGAAGRARSRLLAVFGAAARRRIASAGLPEPPRVLGLAEAGRMTSARFRALLLRLPRRGDFEVVLHPGADDASARAHYPWGYSWEEEAAALESDDLRRLLLERGAEVVPFSSLAAP